MNDKPLRPWLILLPDATIASAHCDCMAGLGEVCSHTAAVAFALYFKNPYMESISCTDKLSIWPAPITSKAIVQKKN